MSFNVISYMYVCLKALGLIRRVYKYCLEEKKTLAVVATAQRKAGLLEKAQYIEF